MRRSTFRTLRDANAISQRVSGAQRDFSRAAAIVVSVSCFRARYATSYRAGVRTTGGGGGYHRDANVLSSCFFLTTNMDDATAIAYDYNYFIL